MYWDVSQNTVDGFKPLFGNENWGKQNDHQDAYEIIYEIGYHLEANNKN
jgi:hypothetical protein